MSSTRGARDAPYGSACRPGIISGSAKGRKRMVPAVNSPISAAARARSPRAVSTSFGRNGAPAAPPSRSRPMACPRWSGIKTVSSHAKAGASTKFKPSARTTSRTLRSGAAIARSVSVSPVASMLLTRKIGTESFWSRCSRSGMGFRAFRCRPTGRVERDQSWARVARSCLRLLPVLACALAVLRAPKWRRHKGRFPPVSDQRRTFRGRLVCAVGLCSCGCVFVVGLCGGKTFEKA